MYIVGGLSDQTIYYVWGKISSLFSIANPILANYFPYSFRFRYLVNPLLSNQPISATIFSVFTTIFGLNTLLLVTLLLNFIFSYLFFRRFKNGWVYTLIFCLSTYFLIHFGIHIVLSQIWVFPIFFNVLFKWQEEKSLKSCFLIGLTACFITLISNYYGFFILLFLAIYSITELIIRKKRPHFLSIGICLALLSLMLLPYFKAAYFMRDTMNTRALNRGLEDVITFSSRPWYFVVPPVKNPILGEISREFISQIESTKYFLADDYFANEHMGNYFGMFFILSLLVSCVYVFKKATPDLKKKVGSFLATSLVLMSFMQPPFFTISGLRIYTPGYLLYRFFPMFRVTSRISILVLFLLLIIFGISFNYLCSVYKGKKLNLTIIGLAILVLTIFETFVPVKIVKMDKVPEVYQYMRKNTDENSVFVVYPYSKTQDAFYWLPAHERLFANNREYSYGDFDSETFTKSLNTNEGIDALLRLGADYLVVSKDVSIEELSFFDSLNELSLKKIFSEDRLYLISK